MTIRIQHGKVSLALHPLRESGSGRPLLLLHGRGERSPARLPKACASWPGPVYALDFTGHGESQVPAGGGYTCELLMADADAALARIGPATVVGRGVGAYVALLAAGARPKLVRGAVLCDGPGLSGTGPRPGSTCIPLPDLNAPAPPDPFALIELALDVRPPDYAATFVRLANQHSGLARPISVCAIERPEWLRAVVDDPGVEVTTLEEALAHYAGVD